MANSKKRRGPPKGTPKGARTIGGIVSAILSPTKPYPIPGDPEALKQLLVDLALHIKSLEEEIEELHHQDQPPSRTQSPHQIPASQVQAQAHSVSSPGSQTGRVHSPGSPAPSESGLNGLTGSPGSGVARGPFAVSTSPPESDGPKEEGLSYMVKRLVLDQQVDKEWGSANVVTSVTKDTPSLKEVKVEEQEDVESFRHSASSFLQSSASQSARRPEIWAIYPWQIPPEEHPLPLHFPDDDLLPSLVDMYFTNINRFLPLLHRPTFERSIAEGLHHRDRQFGFVVLAVCACGARHSNDPRIYYEESKNEYSIGWKWFKQIQLIRSNFTIPPTLYELQLCVVAVMFLQSTSTPEACWILTSLGIRYAQDVSAHRRRPGKPTIERELWKRAFWGLYILDVFVSAFMGRPRATSADDFDVDLPIECDDEYWETEDPEQAFKQPPGTLSYMSAWITFLKLLDIMSIAQRTVYAVRRSDFWTAMGMSGPEWNEKVVSELDSLLNNWVDSVPDHLKWDPHRENPIFFHQSVMLYTSYYWVQMLVHKPFIPKPGYNYHGRQGYGYNYASGYGQNQSISFPSMAICANAARSCCHVMEVLHVQRKGFLAMPNVVMALHNSAVILLLNAWRGKHSQISVDTNKEMMDVYKCMSMIRTYETRWQSGGTYNDVLCELISITNISDPSPSSFPSSDGHPSLKRMREGESRSQVNGHQQYLSISQGQTTTIMAVAGNSNSTLSPSSSLVGQSLSFPRSYAHYLQQQQQHRPQIRRPSSVLPTITTATTTTNEKETTTTSLSVVDPQATPTNTNPNPNFFNLPMYSTELASLPLHESFRFDFDFEMMSSGSGSGVEHSEQSQVIDHHGLGIEVGMMEGDEGFMRGMGIGTGRDYGSTTGAATSPTPQHHVLGWTGSESGTDVMVPSMSTDPSALDGGRSGSGSIGVGIGLGSVPPTTAVTFGSEFGLGPMEVGMEQLQESVYTKHIMAESLSSAMGGTGYISVSDNIHKDKVIGDSQASSGSGRGGSSSGGGDDVEADAVGGLPDYNDANWQDWNRYMSDVDELLHAMTANVASNEMW